MPSCQILYTPIPLFSCPSGGDQLGEHDGSDKTIEGPSGAQDGDTIFYVGGESLTLTNLLMTHASCEVGVISTQMRYQMINFNSL